MFSFAAPVRSISHRNHSSSLSQPKNAVARVSDSFRANGAESSRLLWRPVLLLCCLAAPMAQLPRIPRPTPAAIQRRRPRPSRLGQHRRFRA